MNFQKKIFLGVVSSLLCGAAFCSSTQYTKTYGTPQQSSINDQTTPAIPARCNCNNPVDIPANISQTGSAVKGCMLYNTTENAVQPMCSFEGGKDFSSSTNPSDTFIATCKNNQTPMLVYGNYTSSGTVLKGSVASNGYYDVATQYVNSGQYVYVTEIVCSYQSS